MKKILSFIFIATLLGFSFSFSNKFEGVFEFFPQGQCEFYVKTSSNQNLPSFAAVVQNGEFSFVRTTTELAHYLSKNLNDIEGITIFGKASAEEIIKKFSIKISHIEKVGDITHYFGFSSQFEKFVFIKGKKHNVHIVEKQNQILFGVPIIYGSY